MLSVLTLIIHPWEGFFLGLVWFGLVFEKCHLCGTVYPFLVPQQSLVWSELNRGSCVQPSIKVVVGRKPPIPKSSLWYLEALNYLITKNRNTSCGAKPCQPLTSWSKQWDVHHPSCCHVHRFKISRGALLWGWWRSGLPDLRISVQVFAYVPSQGFLVCQWPGCSNNFIRIINRWKGVGDTEIIDNVENYKWVKGHGLDWLLWNSF